MVLDFGNNINLIPRPSLTLLMHASPHLGGHCTTNFPVHRRSFPPSAIASTSAKQCWRQRVWGRWSCRPFSWIILPPGISSPLVSPSMYVSLLLPPLSSSLTPLLRFFHSISTLLLLSRLVRTDLPAGSSLLPVLACLNSRYAAVAWAAFQSLGLGKLELVYCVLLWFIVLCVLKFCCIGIQLESRAVLLLLVRMVFVWLIEMRAAVNNWDWFFGALRFICFF